MREKSVALAYVLWFFFGYVGVHRMYSGHLATGMAMFCGALVGGIGFSLWFGQFLVLLVGAWWLLDLFLTAGLVESRPIM
ncbi:NINE protein [Alicyclobacillaceae bacterium I2511]|nr:NINE protein [Alicyclobacillaceae bacterium I2511]